MGKGLHRLGAWAFDHKWWVISAWIVILGGLGLLAAKNYTSPSSAVSIPGTEAQKALDRFSSLFPDGGKGTGRIVFETKNGSQISQYQSEIDGVVKNIEEVHGVATVVNPFETQGLAISKDGTIAYATVSLEHEAGSIDDSTTSAIEKIVTKTRSNSLAVEMGGDVVNKMPGEILGVGEVGGVIFALVVLIMTLGALVAAGFPIIVAIVSVGAGTMGLFGLSHVVTISSTTPVLAVMLGLAVGIDYSLFIVNKYRYYLLHGYSNKDAAGKSIATAGNAVVFAAATVVIALSALAIVRIPFMTTMGLAAAGTVATAAVVAITLLPALFGVVKSHIFRGKTKKAIIKAQKIGPKESHTLSHKTVWYKLAEKITKHPVQLIVGIIVVIGIVAIPVRSLNLGLPSDEYAAKNTTERKAYDILTKGFGAGFNGPLVVVVDHLKPVTADDKQVVRQTLEAAYDKKVAEATGQQEAAFQAKAAAATTPEAMVALQQEVIAAQEKGAAQQKVAKAELETQIESYAKLYELNKIADKMKSVEGVDSAIPAMVTQDGTSGVIQVIPKTGPADRKTKDLIAYLRSDTHADNLAGYNVAFGVTGTSALNGDINAKLSAALPQYLAVVVGLSFILLMILFRSVLVPLKATLGFLLSVGAMFGALVVAFQWGWFGLTDAPGPIVSFIPIISIGILFGLAMDYEFFLVSSMHEEYQRTKDAKKAVINGFAVGSPVVVAAAVIMVAVFAGFVTNSDSIIQSIGFCLAFGIFVDAFIVRLLLVPAVMSLLGERAWWLPTWLTALLPHISIEGEEDTKE